MYVRTMEIVFGARSSDVRICDASAPREGLSMMLALVFAGGCFRLKFRPVNFLSWPNHGVRAAQESRPRVVSPTIYLRANHPEEGSSSYPPLTEILLRVQREGGGGDNCETG
jgi:hypothetical protein